MRRDLTRLATEPFDIVVVGGGILGACAAWDAATRGLAVALIERRDFGSGTTAASGKVAHGGLRYLQHLDFRAAWEAGAEQAVLHRLAPELTRPLTFAVPAPGDRWRDRTLLRGAAAAWRAFRTVCPGAEGLRGPQFLAPRTTASSDHLIDGRAVLQFHDLQIRSPERLTLAIAEEAYRAGAVVANHTEAVGLRLADSRVVGVDVRDALTADRFPVRARLVLNVAGPWAPGLWSATPSGAAPVAFAKGMHVVVDRPEPAMAVALPWPAQRTTSRLSDTGRRVFVMPWEGLTLIGATYAPFDAHPDRARPTAIEIAEFVDTVSARWPQLGVSHDRVRFAYAGLYPIFHRTAATPNVFAASRRPLIIDHQRLVGTVGLLSAVSVKLTTARRLAERIIDLAQHRLGTPRTPSVTARHGPLAMAGAAPLRFIAPGRRALGELEPAVRVAVEREMALALGDFVFRRSMIGHHGHPGMSCLRRIADIMGHLLHWSDQEMAGQLASINRHYVDLGLAERPMPSKVVDDRP